MHARNGCSMKFIKLWETLYMFQSSYGAKEDAQFHLWRQCGSLCQWSASDQVTLLYTHTAQHHCVSLPAASACLSPTSRGLVALPHPLVAMTTTHLAHCTRSWRHFRRRDARLLASRGTAIVLQTVHDAAVCSAELASHQLCTFNQQYSFSQSVGLRTVVVNPASDNTHNVYRSLRITKRLKLKLLQMLNAKQTSASLLHLYRPPRCSVDYMCQQLVANKSIKN